MDRDLTKIPQLYNIIASILCDISKAQDISNKYSVELARQYRDHNSGLLKEFPVPNGVLDELKIDFKLMAEEVLDDEQDINSLQCYKWAFEDAAKQIAKDASSELAKVAYSSRKANNNEEKSILNEIIVSLNSSRWLRHLSNKILTNLSEFALENNFASLKTKPGTEVINNLIKMLEQSLINHDDIVNLKLSDELIKNIEDNIKEYEHKWLEQIWQSLLAYKKSTVVPTLLGQINGTEVDNSELYAKFSMNIKVREFTWDVAIEEDTDKTKVTINRLKRQKN